MTAARLLCAAVSALVLAGCASSPPSRFYTLSGAPASVRPVTGPAIAVGPVSIPAVVDRPEIVVTIGDNEVWLDEFNRWAAPLADGIGLAIAENLAANLQTSRVTVNAQTAGGEPDYRVVVEVQRFESAPGAYALFDALWSVRRVRDGASTGGRTTVRESVSERGYDALAAAHSRSLARMTQDIAAGVGKLAAPRAPTPSPVR